MSHSLQTNNISLRLLGDNNRHEHIRLIFENVSHGFEHNHGKYRKTHRHWCQGGWSSKLVSHYISYFFWTMDLLPKSHLNHNQYYTVTVDEWAHHIFGCASDYLSTHQINVGLANIKKKRRHPWTQLSTGSIFNTNSLPHAGGHLFPSDERHWALLLVHKHWFR